MASARSLRFDGLGLRGRLTLLIAATLTVALAGTFAVLYQGTGSDLRGRIDGDLRGQVADLTARIRTADSPSRARAVARRYVSTQPFKASSRLLIVDVPGEPIATNEPEVVGLVERSENEGTDELARERAQARALSVAPPGFSTVEVQEVGRVRLLTRTVKTAAAGAVVVRAGEPLASVDRAEDGLARTFLLAGALALLVSLAGGYLVAARVFAPLRRMARTAAEVDAGELSRRIGASGPRDEVRALAVSFDRMLDRLQEAFASQRAFVADASHELRTPLTVIRGQLEVLSRQRHPDAEEIKRVERQVAIEVVRMQRLVDDLLLLARGDEGLTLQRQPIDLPSFLRDLLDSPAATTDRRFETSPLPEGEVAADPQLLAQLLRNLLRNAVEHTGAGGLIAIRAEARGTLLEVAVDDDGPGIAPADRDLVFNRFHRTDSSRARATGGSGLGLAIARAIAEAHGGRIWATRAPEGGARVVFELPSFTPRSERSLAV